MVKKAKDEYTANKRGREKGMEGEMEKGKKEGIEAIIKVKEG